MWHVKAIYDNKSKIMAARLLIVLGAVKFKLHNLTSGVEIYAMGDNHIMNFVKKSWLST